MKTLIRSSVNYARITTLALGTLLGGIAVTAHAYSGEALAAGAKVKLAEAKTIALKAYPGKIVKTELEKEKGGSGLRYSFDIRHGKTTHEVGVDAQTGQVLENGPDTD